MTKACSTCGVTKPLDAFSPHKGCKYGVQSRCKECCAAIKRQKYADDPQKYIDIVADYRATETGYFVHRKVSWRARGIIDVDTLDWEELIESQSGKCLVCGSSIDARTAWREHDHETGLTRGAVCGSKCNLAMDHV